MRADAAWNRCIPRDDPAGRDVSYCDLLSIRTHNVLEDAVRVEKAVPVMVADDHSVVADAINLGVGVYRLPVI